MGMDKKMMNFKIDKDLKIKLGVSFIASVILAVALFGVIGKKNSALLFVSAFLTIFAISMIKDSKKSMLIFIVSLPVLVTARKFFYYDLFIFKLSFESVYITILFAANIKSIYGVLKDSVTKGNKITFNFIAYTLVFIILALNSSIFSISLMSSIRLTFIAVIIPIMFMLCVIAKFKKDEIKYIIYALIIQCSFSSMYGFMQIAKIARHGISLSRINAHRMEYTFGYHNVNIYAAIALLILPFIFERILYHNNSKNEKLFLYITCAINVMGILATFTRGAWFMFLLGFAIVLISKKYKKIMYVGGALLILVSKPLFTFILHRGMGSSVELMSNESLLARIEATLTSFKVMFDYPFGIGFGNYAEFYKRYISNAYQMLPYDFRTRITVASYNMEHAHNLFLQIAVELGIVTAIIFIVIIVNRLSYAFKHFSEQRAAISALIIYFIYSVMTGGQFEHKGVITGTILLWLVFGILQIEALSSPDDQTI